jgi:hypothetical protein
MKPGTGVIAAEISASAGGLHRRRVNKLDNFSAVNIIQGI